MYRFTMRALGLLILGLVVAFYVTNPKTLNSDVIEGVTGNAANGEYVFWAAGCVSCHSAEKSKGADRLILSGGRKFPSPFGVFIAPNISPDHSNGIGGWSLLEFANAVQKGVSPDGAHYYPAFPYTSYVNAEIQDIADLKVFMDTLPVSNVASLPHEVGFPFNIRRSLGGWKTLFYKRSWALSGELNTAEIRGRYLVEALGHCTECHTARNLLGGLQRNAWLAGATDPTGKFQIPNITPQKLSWSEDEIFDYFTTGFTPDFDTAGGHMADVVENLALLPETDRRAIVAYLKKLPPK
jgi:mono/diheme cytochrome c family protein